MKGMLSFLDIIAILLIVFMAISALLAKNAGDKYRKEYQTKVELLEKARQQEEQKGQDIGESDLFISVTAEGKMVMEGSPLPSAKTVGSVLEMGDALKLLRPTKAYLRVDKSVPTGTTQEILLICQELGVLGYLVAAEPAVGR
ncbi:ExbD/TolR family protein [Desulfomicrobium baculatum]|uniref:Biopolymer transport protein ExbD/TolR n=1 Tax=Desulfomicrobium baculatum (strain DSM 4028 / VKM B-1378 / X) TaxID=525897 RepID=C7LRW6_DESBD|nr:biopolymer transporter ExbD [Desulfomicrobium baculatum]ACU89349.1 Biopolymer transport protein ExbD/TolR [Desulfomicrobium baculatum DSM 4028]